MISICCSMMEHNSTKVPLQSNKDMSCPALISYIPKFNEYGLINPNLHSHTVIYYCPWCGKSLIPWNLRDQWFEKLEDQGYTDLLFNENIPESYKSEKWWTNKVQDTKGNTGDG